MLAAGALLAALEIGWVLVRAQGLFLSLGERLLYALASLGVAVAAVLALGTAMLVARAGWLRVLFSLGAAEVVAHLAWLLSAGRRVHELAVRPYAVAALALLAGGIVYAALGTLTRQMIATEGLAPSSARSVRVRVTCLAWPAALAVLCADALVLPRGYPAFHLALVLGALAIASYAALLAPPAMNVRFLRRAPWAALLLVIAGVAAATRLAAHPTAGFAVREKAPWTSHVTRLLEPTRRARIPAVQASSAQVARAGVDLRDRDVLLITVDALRADLLRAYGGTREVAPALDQLAEESAVFTRAYTPAPHTSYALASLLTGKFVKPLVELGQPLGDPQTLPDRLRRYGYRTAAFYPPAIFFVDGASFAPLAARGFGFEYRKEMFASAAERVEQLDDYLREADPERPLFVWVHLFEPHEPYDPPAELAHDGSERGRYEAEVRAADRGIAQLVARFRAAKPRATVIVTADHGEEFGDHGGSFHGSSLYDEQIRIPLLWSSPGAVMPRRIDAPVELTDIGTTILSTAGVPRDALMRGDDLAGVLLGEAGPRHAFSSIDARHMVSDGTFKLICGARELHCALFDLVRDPREQQNVVASEAARADALRGALDAFLASIPRNEAVAVSQGVGLPEALARAKLGAAVPLSELLRSLADTRPVVRVETARVLAMLGDAQAQPALASARQHDEDADVRAEAAIASLAVGDLEAREPVRVLLEVPGGAAPERSRRAALALAFRAEPGDDARVVPLLAATIADQNASEGERLHALRALATLGSPLGIPAAVAALANVRLCEQAARTLGALGGPHALQALRTQLAGERYPAARYAEAEALRKLGDRSVAERVRQFLGMHSSLPHGVQLLAELGALDPPSRAGGRVAALKRGSWQCSQLGCTPEGEAGLELPARGTLPTGAQRVTVWVEATQAGTIVIDGETFAVQPGDSQLSFERPRAPRRLRVAADAQVTLRALVVAPSRAEIPPPPPEPWEASEEADAGLASPVGAGSGEASAPLR